MYRHRHHSFLGIALFVFVVWLVLFAFIHIVSWVIHLLWIIIIVALVWWLFHVFFGRRRSTRW